MFNREATLQDTHTHTHTVANRSHVPLLAEQREIHVLSSGGTFNTDLKICFCSEFSSFLSYHSALLIFRSENYGEVP